MIHPLLTKGRVLFIRDGCDYCKKWDKFIYKLNTELKLNKRIKIIDCTNYHNHGIIDNPIIKLFENFLEEYPTLFFEGEIKRGVNSVLECKAWLITRLLVGGDFIFPRIPEYLPTLEKYSIFNLDCKHHKGRIICEEID